MQTDLLRSARIFLESRFIDQDMYVSPLLDETWLRSQNSAVTTPDLGFCLVLLDVHLGQRRLIMLYIYAQALSIKWSSLTCHDIGSGSMTDLGRRRDRACRHDHSHSPDLPTGPDPPDLLYQCRIPYLVYADRGRARPRRTFQPFVVFIKDMTYCAMAISVLEGASIQLGNVAQSL